MSKIIKEIEKTLKKFDQDILNVQNDNCDVFTILTKHVYVIINKDKVLLSFKATLKPELAAMIALSLYEIKIIKTLDIASSFIISEDDKLFYGEEAFEFVRQAIESQIKEDYDKHMMYNSILMSHPGYPC